MMEIKIDLSSGRLYIDIENREFGTDIPDPAGDTPSDIIVAVRQALTDMKRVFSGKTFKDFRDAEDDLSGVVPAVERFLRNEAIEAVTPEPNPDGSVNDVLIKDDSKDSLNVTDRVEAQVNKSSDDFHLPGNPRSG